MGLCRGKGVGEYRQGRIPENPTRASRQPLRPAHANCCHSQTQSRPSSASPASPVHVSPSTLKERATISSFQGCQTNWLIQENSETERQGERGCMQPSLISLESGSRLSQREA